MSRHVHVDRQPELRLFQDILEGRRDECILLIEAPSGLGKTLLMLEYQRLAEKAEIPCAMLDLRHVGVAVFEILATLCDEWSDCPFHQFRQQIASFQQPVPRVDLHRVIQIGSPTIQIALNAPDEATRRERRHLITAALVADLQDWLGHERRALMIMDTYNPDLVTPELRQWVEGILLPHVRRCPSLIAVIAGQETPTTTVMWEQSCYHLPLRRLHNPHDWMHFVQERGIPLTLENVAMICHLREGHPFEIVMELSKLETWTWGDES